MIFFSINGNLTPRRWVNRVWGPSLANGVLIIDRFLTFQWHAEDEHVVAERVKEIRDVVKIPPCS